MSALGCHILYNGTHHGAHTDVYPIMYTTYIHGLLWALLV